MTSNHSVMQQRVQKLLEKIRLHFLQKGVCNMVVVLLYVFAIVFLCCSVYSNVSLRHLGHVICSHVMPCVCMYAHDE